MGLYIIFLDTDGVLLPFPSNSQNSKSSKGLIFPDSTLSAFQRLLTELNQITSNHAMTKNKKNSKHNNNNNNNDNNNDNKCQIVLSSTWRVRKDYIYDIESALHEFGGIWTRNENDNTFSTTSTSTTTTGFFYDITDPNLHSERQWEIQHWLASKTTTTTTTNIDAWLALDDEELIHGETNEKHRNIFQGHVIQTKSSIGLTMQDVDEAIRLWKLQLSSSL